MMLPIDLNLLNQTPAKYTPADDRLTKIKPAFVQTLTARLARFQSKLPKPSENKHTGSGRPQLGRFLPLETPET